MTDLLLIDGNSIGFASNAGKKLHTGDQETQAIFGFLRTLRALLQDNPKAQPVVFWDGRSWRYDVFADYKGTREETKQQIEERASYKTQRPLIGRALSALGVRQMMAPNLEADDLIALFSIEHAKQGLHCTIVSGDRDLIQLVQPNVDWYTPIRLPGGRNPKIMRVTHDSFEEDTEYATPSAYVMGKALLGDSSDNLKGIDGIGKKAAPLVVRSWPQISVLFEDVQMRGDAAIPPELSRYKQKLKTFAGSDVAKEQFLRNFRLMRLTPSFIPEPTKVVDQQTSFGINAFQIICQELGFVSLLQDLETWCAPFEERGFKPIDALAA